MTAQADPLSPGEIAAMPLPQLSALSAILQAAIATKASAASDRLDMEVVIEDDMVSLVVSHEVPAADQVTP